MTGNDITTADNAQKADAWMDLVAQDEDLESRSESHGRWQTWYKRAVDLLATPFNRVSAMSSFLATTPGRMFGITILLTVAIFAAGYSMSQSSASRQAGLNVLLTETEPLNFAAHKTYTNLALADGTATSEFVRSGADSQQSNDAFFEAIDGAALAATESAAGITTSDPRVAQLVSTIVRELPIYTAMIDTARTNSRMGNPVSVTYLSNASSLMQETILPAASDLFALTSAEVARQQKELTTPQWVPLSGLFAAAFFLGLAQWWLWKTTRRRFNRGFLTATALMAVAIVWVSASNFATWQAGGKGFQEASHPWDSLTTSRILAQQVHTSETLMLVQRDTADQSAGQFKEMALKVQDALDDVTALLPKDSGSGIFSARKPQVSDEAHTSVDKAQQALNDWNTAHRDLVSAFGNGDYDRAVETGTSLDESDGVTAAGAASRLDKALSQLIEDSRSSMRQFIAEGLAATSLVSAAVLVLAFAAILCIWLGIRARLQEYL